MDACITVERHNTRRRQVSSIPRLRHFALPLPLSICSPSLSPVKCPLIACFSIIQCYCFCQPGLPLPSKTLWSAIRTSLEPSLGAHSAHSVFMVNVRARSSWNAALRTRQARFANTVLSWPLPSTLRWVLALSFWSSGVNQRPDPFYVDWPVKPEQPEPALTAQLLCRRHRVHLRQRRRAHHVHLPTRWSAQYQDGLSCTWLQHSSRGSHLSQGGWRVQWLHPGGTGEHLLADGTLKEILKCLCFPCSMRATWWWSMTWEPCSIPSETSSRVLMMSSITFSATGEMDPTLHSKSMTWKLSPRHPQVIPKMKNHSKHPLVLKRRSEVKSLERYFHNFHIVLMLHFCCLFPMPLRIFHWMETNCTFCIPFVVSFYKTNPHTT